MTSPDLINPIPKRFRALMNTSVIESTNTYTTVFILFTQQEI